MKLVVCTQYWENYGDAEKPYWKAKGGDFIIVAHLSTQETVAMGQKGLQEIVNRATKIIDDYNPMSQEYVIDWHLLEDFQLTRDEEAQLEFEGKIDYPAKDISEEINNVQ